MNLIIAILAFIGGCVVITFFCVIIFYFVMRNRRDNDLTKKERDLMDSLGDD